VFAAPRGHLLVHGTTSRQGLAQLQVCDVADVQAAPTPPVDEYMYDSTVGSNDEAPAKSRRAPSKVAALLRTR
jgi:hypothetical protein